MKRVLKIISIPHLNPSTPFGITVLPWLFIIAISLIILGGNTAHGVSTISQGFNTEEDIPIGAIVSLKDSSSDFVESATVNTVDTIIGVAVNEASFPLSLSNKNSEQIQVAVNGIAPILVSDIAGEVKRGDHITASIINGVGMKATTNTKVVGIAQADASYEGDSSQTVNTESGEETVQIGQVPVQVNVSYFFAESERSVIPKAFQNVANSIAGRQVDPVPIIISGAIFIATIIVVASIVYSMIRSSIISVGRNPLSQSAVIRGVIQLSALVVGILGVGVAAIYLILTRL